MAIYHLHAQVLSRSGGSSAVAAAAYRAGADLIDERTGERHDYTRRSGVDGAEILVPEDAPARFRDRSRLWNGAEAAERRRDAQVAREVCVAIPVELGEGERRELVRGFVRDQFTRRGMVADVAWHGSGTDNPHAHILLTMRKPDGEGFAARKERGWNSRQVLEGWREAWADHANRSLERSGNRERIDHRTLAAQREEALSLGDTGRAGALDREPTIHLGRAAVYMEARGVETERGDRHLAIDTRNRERRLSRLRGRVREWSRRLQDLGQRLQEAAGRRWPERDRPARRRQDPARRPAPGAGPGRQHHREMEGPDR